MLTLTKRILGFAVLCSSTYAVAQTTVTRYTVNAQDKKIGTAEITQSLKADKTMLFRLRMLLGPAKNAVEVQIDAIYDSKGRTLKESFLTTIGKDRTIQATTYSGAKATYIVIEKGKTTKTLTSTLGKGKLRDDPSVFWFLSVKPQVGAKVSYWSFDGDKDEWKLESTHFRGREEIKVSGKSVTANCLVSSGSVQYLDDRGTIVRMELDSGDNKMVLERIGDK